ncbi:MAG TPA: diacylglycerol kinase family protein [Thermomicrobiales bacterium]|nr:diacylglycerol kinase family protein [Thermomicrobiales bacterium]
MIADLPRSETPREPGAQALDVIINPAAGSGRAGRLWPGFARTLEARGYVVRAHQTAAPGDATRLATSLAEHGASTIVCVGGDGTVNEVVNGLIVDDRAVNPDLKLAIIACGTGKDLVRSLGTRDLNTTIQALAGGVMTLIDVGRVHYIEPRTGHLEARYFVNVADAGLGATVAARINASSKRLGGLITYLRAAVSTIAGHTAWEASIDIDGELAYEGRVGMVVFANGRYFAGGMRVAPDASLCDGMIDVFILQDVGKRALLTSLLPRVYRGRHVGQPGVTHATAGTVSLRSTSGMLVELDGEQVGRAPLSVTMVPRVLRVVGTAALEAMSGCADARP